MCLCASVCLSACPVCLSACLSVVSIRCCRHRVRAVSTHPHAPNEDIGSSTQCSFTHPSASPRCVVLCCRAPQLPVMPASRPLLQRSGYNLLVLNDVMWIVGGTPSLPVVWSSDGVDWQPAPDSLGNSSIARRFGASALVSWCDAGSVARRCSADAIVTAFLLRTLVVNRMRVPE